jgi:hypothetical protein
MIGLNATWRLFVPKSLLGAAAQPPPFGCMLHNYTRFLNTAKPRLISAKAKAVSLLTGYNAQGSKN